MRPKPTSIIAQVAGSGTAAVGEKLGRWATEPSCVVKVPPRTKSVALVRKM